jgi:hypothetical protein
MHTAPTATSSIVIIPLYFGPNNRSNNIKRIPHNREKMMPLNIITSMIIANALSNFFPSCNQFLHAGHR